MAYTIRFPDNVEKTLDEITKFEGITKAELIRRSINFYAGVKIEALKKNKSLFFENADGMKERIVL